GAERAYTSALDIMADYDIVTAKRYMTLQAIILPLQMQQKNQEALRYSQILAETPQGEMNVAYQNVVSMFQSGERSEAEAELRELLASAPNHPGSNILLGLSRYEEGDYEQAEQLLSRFVDIDTASSQLVRT